MARKKKDSVEVQWNGMPSDEATLKEIKAAVESTYDSYHTIEESKADIKEVFDDIHVRTGIPKKVFNFLAKSNYKGNAYETIQSNTELQEAYDALNKVSL